MGTSLEHNGNTLGTGENAKKILLPPPPTNLWKKIKMGLPFACINFSSQKSLSPFLAWANIPCKEHPTYYYPLSKVD
jgi:hypothetical protein